LFSALASENSQLLASLANVLKNLSTLLLEHNVGMFDTHHITRQANKSSPYRIPDLSRVASPGQSTMHYVPMAVHTKESEQGSMYQAKRHPAGTRGIMYQEW
jgi:hypothetical protein